MPLPTLPRNHLSQKVIMKIILITMLVPGHGSLQSSCENETSKELHNFSSPSETWAVVANWLQISL